MKLHFSIQVESEQGRHGEERFGEPSHQPACMWLTEAMKSPYLTSLLLHARNGLMRHLNVIECPGWYLSLHLSNSLGFASCRLAASCTAVSVCYPRYIRSCIQPSYAGRAQRENRAGLWPEAACWCQ